MQLTISRFCCVLIILLLVASSIPVSANVSNNTPYISETIFINNDILVDYPDKSCLSQELTIFILNDMDMALLEFEYNDHLYTGVINGSVVELSLVSGGFAGVFGGVLQKHDDPNDADIYVDATTIFTNNDIVCILSIGKLSDNNTPMIVMYGEMTNDLKILTSEYSEMQSNHHSESELINIDSEESVINGTVDGSISVNSSIDLSCTYRGTYYSRVEGYDLFNFSVFCQNNLINGNEMDVYAKVNTSSDSFVEYLREVEGYDNVSKGIALTAKPYIVDISIGGYHQDFSVQLSDCTPKNGEKRLPLILPYIIFKETGPEINNVSIDLLVDKVELSESKYVNTPASIPWYQIANWTMHKSDWYNNSIDGDATSQNGVPFKAVLKYQGAVSQTVGRYVNVTASVRYYVNVQVSAGVVPVIITTDEYSATSILFVYPATAG